MIKRLTTIIFITTLSISSLFAGNPELPKEGPHTLKSHWQIGAGYGPAYSVLGVQIKKTVPFFEEGRIGGWAALGINWGLTYAAGIDFYLTNSFYLGVNYGPVGSYKTTTYDPIYYTENVSFYNRNGFAGTLNYDWFFSENWGLNVGAGLGLATDGVDVDPMTIRINLGLKYAFEGF